MWPQVMEVEPKQFPHWRALSCTSKVPFGEQVSPSSWVRGAREPLLAQAPSPAQRGAPCWTPWEAPKPSVASSPSKHLGLTPQTLTSLIDWKSEGGWERKLRLTHCQGSEDPLSSSNPVVFITLITCPHSSQKTILLSSPNIETSKSRMGLVYIYSPNI